MGWEKELRESKVRSIIAASCDTIAPQAKETLLPRGILVLIEVQPRAWKREDRQFVQLVARQLGVVLQQWHLAKRQQSLELLLEGIPEAIAAINSADGPASLYEAVTQSLQRLLTVPLVGILTWRTSGAAGANTPGQASFAEAKIRQVAYEEDVFALAPCVEAIVVEQDALIQWCLQSPYPIAVGVDDLPQSTLQWLNAPALGQVMAVVFDAAGTPYLPSSLIVVGAPRNRQWLEGGAYGALVRTDVFCFGDGSVTGPTAINGSGGGIDRVELV